jgi:hypothetical protein
MDILKTLESKDIEKNVVMYNRALKACVVAKDYGKLKEVRAFASHTMPHLFFTEAALHAFLNERARRASLSHDWTPRTYRRSAPV